MSKLAVESPLHADLLALLQAARSAERDIFGTLDPDARATPGRLGDWSAKDVQAHLAAWRSSEARRLEATAGAAPATDDPQPDDPIDASNAHLHARAAGLSWDEVDRSADASIEALEAAIDRSTTTALCECDGTAAGIGVNGVNHALGHLTDVAQLTGERRRFDAFVREVEAVLHRGHVPPHDSGVLLYNIACHRTLSGETDEARRLLRDAFHRRRDLLDVARDDPDLATLHGELDTLV